MVLPPETCCAWQLYEARHAHQPGVSTGYKTAPCERELPLIALPHESPVEVTSLKVTYFECHSACGYCCKAHSKQLTAVLVIIHMQQKFAKMQTK